MKSYEITVKKPMLEIRHDECPTSPREWSNLGMFIISSRKYISPDNEPTIKSVVEETANMVENADEHMDKIKSELTKIGIEAVYVTPIATYEHGARHYMRGVRTGWDYSNNGMYIVTRKSCEELGVDPDDTDAIERIIDNELSHYTMYANGEVYHYTLYNEYGDIEDSCGGFYEIEAMKEYLPESWADEDLTEYIK